MHHVSFAQKSGFQRIGLMRLEEPKHGVTVVALCVQNSRTVSCAYAMCDDVFLDYFLGVLNH